MQLILFFPYWINSLPISSDVFGHDYQVTLEWYMNSGFHTGFFEKGGKPSGTPHLPGNSAFDS